MLSVYCMLCFSVLFQGGIGSRCRNLSCSAPIGNLAIGRPLTTLRGCCGNRSSHSCLAPHHPSLESNLVELLEEEVRLDLETQFYLTHVVAVFRSPRPLAVVLERSRDFAKSWEPIKFFASSCRKTFGLSDDISTPGALCTSRYSSETAAGGGEVIFQALGPANGPSDPYSLEAFDRLSLTNLRIRLLKDQSCPVPIARQLSLPGKETASSPVSVLLVGGTCLCHGHARRCQPLVAYPGTQPHDAMVQGSCVCAHHTAGEHCDRCDLLFNDWPWRAANGSSREPHPCKKCECHGHADSCHFSQRAWLASGGISGGVCDSCRHNTEGSRCQRCRPGYRRHHARPLRSPHACTRKRIMGSERIEHDGVKVGKNPNWTPPCHFSWEETVQVNCLPNVTIRCPSCFGILALLPPGCWCDSVGSVPVEGRPEGRWCHPRSGQCQCKPGVGGMSCSHCLPGYWGFGEEGCKRCPCPQSCDPITGRCQDRHHRETYSIPIGGRISDLADSLTDETGRAGPEELTISTLQYAGKCDCKDKTLRSISAFCKKKYAYVIKASVLSAHDRGTHAEVGVKVRKVLRAGQVSLSQGTHSLYPLSWMTLGCTCPVLTPGVEYLLAGPEEVESGRLLVATWSLALPWTPKLGQQVAEMLRKTCP